jgi:putative membrane protein
MIKKILRFTTLFTFALTLSQYFWGNLFFAHRLTTIITVAFILTLFEVFLKPVIKLLLLPINLLTLGLFRLIINTFGLYLATYLLIDFHVRNIATPSTSVYILTLPPFNFSGFWSYLVTTITLNLCFSLFKFLLSKSK